LKRKSASLSTVSVLTVAIAEG